MVSCRTAYTEMKEKKGITFTEPSRTKQEFAKDCDINLIMDRYKETGLITHVSGLVPIVSDNPDMPVDVSNIPDYRESLDFVMRCEELFLRLPSDFRKELDNDPGKMIEYIKNPDNKEKCIKYGLINPDSSASNNPGDVGGTSAGGSSD